jgi:hypothetical protein
MKEKLKKRLFLSIGVTVLLLIIFAFMQPKAYKSHPKTDGYVPNEVTAIKIAEAIWFPIYGKEIYDYKPFKAELIGGKIWKVYGTVHTEKGGSPIAEIQKNDCKVIKVIHEK